MKRADFVCSVVFIVHALALYSAIENTWAFATCLILAFISSLLHYGVGYFFGLTKKEKKGNP